MTHMYQTVDDPEEIGPDAQNTRAAPRRLIWRGFLLALAALAGFMLWNSSRAPYSAENASASKAEHASYRMAISEPKADLRRARLHDFEITYSQSQLLPTVKAQLAVLNTHETKAWAKLSDVMFDPAATRIDKRAAVQIYESKWGASYLGGRDEDIKALREEIETEPEPTPSRALDTTDSPIPKTVPDTVMVGGPRISPTPAPVRPYVAPPPPPAKTARITPPRVRKNVRPRYPRSAQRRGVNAVVELRLSIDAEGEVQMSEVIRADAARYKKQFIKAAERAAMKTKYTPKRVDGAAVPTNGIKKRYVFQIE